MKPYIDNKISATKWIRTFKESVTPQELLWHRDETNRIIYVLNHTDWLFQFDNQLPIILEQGMELEIPKDVWHRVIKGKNKHLSILVAVKT